MAANFPHGREPDGCRARDVRPFADNGDVLRVISLVAAHVSSDRIVLLDVLLDNAGVPEGADTAWAIQALLGFARPPYRALPGRDQGHGQYGPRCRHDRVLS